MSMRAWNYSLGLGLIGWVLIFWAGGLYPARAMFYTVLGLGVIIATLDSWLDTREQRALRSNQVLCIQRAVRLERITTTPEEERAMDHAACGWFEDEIEEALFERLLNRARCN